MLKRLLTVIPMLALAAPALAADKIPVWIDVDTSTGVQKEGRYADVDDGLLMLYAMHSPELDVKGVSAQFGNATLEQAVPIAREIVEKFAPARYKGMKVRAGAASADDLGKATDATGGIITALEKADGPLTLLALGPVTDVASVIELRPDLKGKVAKIVLVAARRAGFDFGPKEAPGFKFPDANFEKDVPAMRILLDSGVPLVFAGYEVSSHVWVTPADLDKLRDSGAVGAWVADTSRPWIQQWLDNFKTPGFNPFDTLAAAYLTHPQLVESFPAKLSISERVDERAKPEEQAAGKTKPYLDAVEDPSSPHVYLTVPADALHDVIVDRLGTDATTRPAE